MLLGSSALVTVITGMVDDIAPHLKSTAIGITSECLGSLVSHFQYCFAFFPNILWLDF
jgi:hypothetical protein